MRIAAISDLHIGATERTDRFGHRERDFLAFLDRLERSADRVVVLGDLFQTEHGWGLGRAAAARELRRAVRRMPALWARLQDPRYAYVHGNHDAVARDELGALGELRLEADGFAAVFIHGHQFDPLIRRFYPIARMSTWMTGRICHAGFRRAAEWLEWQDVRVKHERFRGPDGPYARAARELLRRRAARAVVMGHTHMAERVELPEGVLANTGTCSRGLRMHVAIDTAARTVELRAGSA